MREPKTNRKRPAATESVGPAIPDAETRALNESAEFQALLAAGDRAIKEGRTSPASEVFRRQRERRRTATAR